MTTAESPKASPSYADVVPSTLNFPVVGIGASAGGVAALISLFEKMPADTGMAFVVVLHLSPKHASGLAALLQAATPMQVVAAVETMGIEANVVYVIPPNKLLSMNDSYLRVTDMARVVGKPAQVDLFFRTLALAHRDRAIAVVLSGSGSDGAVGITRVKGEGGVSIAQNPAEAEFDGMPRAAIATGTIDWVLPVADIPAKLLELWRTYKAIELPYSDDGDAPAAAGTPPDSGAARDAEEAMREVLGLLRTRTGHDFRNYKRATVLRRLERRLQVNGLTNLPAYRGFLQTQPEEAQALLKDLLIGVTNFFRDTDAFDVLQREVLQPLLAEGGELLRAWVAGCSTGEEAYSIAMMLTEETASMAHPPRIQMFGTDIDDSAIAVARLGSYPGSIETDVNPARLRRFFDKEGDQYRVRKEVREKVMFAAHNVLRDPPFSRLDLISCRNLLIYFDREVHASVLEMFHFALRPGGYLFLGSSESADTAAHLFSVVDKKNRIYRANPVSRAPRVMPNLPLGVVKTAMPIAQALQPGDARPEKRRLSYAQLHQRLAEQHAPPSVLIDDEANIVHLSQEAGRFLRLAGGAPSHQLLDLVQPELRGELRTAVFQAVRSGRSVEARRVKMEREGRNLLVNMIVRPVQEPELGGRFVLVLFDQVEDAVSGEAIAPDGDLRDPVVLQLEEELRRVKEQLQSTIEDAETSTEELKASNEELQSINEELRSTTEELETSKEELQSINEELITVNHELKSKVDETVKVNDDLQNLIASTDIATVFVDRAMSIKRFTPRATRLFNLIPGDIGRSLLDITHRLDYAGLPEDAAEAFQSLRVIEREVAGDDGSWYLARALPYRTTEDRIDGAVLTFIDITSRRRAEQTMRLVTESTRDYAILTFDLEGRITTWNLAAERVFGYTESDAVGRSVAVLFTPEDLNAGVLDEEMRLAHEDGRAEDERWHVRKDGSRLYCSGITTPLYENGRLNGYGKIARDLTGSKRAEHEREMQLRIEAAGRAEAQAANELKDEFLAVMSHELKNPLNLIQLNAELLARVPEARALPVVARAADTIRRAVRSQAQIIDDLLDLSRAKTGKLGLERTPVDWSETIRMIAAAMHDDVRAKPLQLTLELPGEPVIVDADRVRVEQIVWNLLSNAVKFTPPEGRIDVRLAVDGDFARFEVADTGRGMPPEFLPHAFDMFRQAEANGLRRHGGLGIGLGLVKHVAEAHGGRVEVRSEGLDLGTTLTVWLPLHQAGAESPPAVEGPVGRVQGLRALVVDDDRQGAEALRQLLATENVTVSCEYSAAGALAALKQAPVDFVLTDMAMPGQDGFHLIRALRENPATSALPVIALTGLSRPSDARRAESAGFAALLNKPITLELLLQTLHRVLQR